MLISCPILSFVRKSSTTSGKYFPSNSEYIFSCSIFLLSFSLFLSYKGPHKKTIGLFIVMVSNNVYSFIFFSIKKESYSGKRVNKLMSKRREQRPRAEESERINLLTLFPLIKLFITTSSSTNTRILYSL